MQSKREEKMKSQILKDAKVNLYLQLLKNVNLTNNETEIIFWLSKDEDIQAVLNEK